MKRFVLVLIGAIITCAVGAQIVEQGESALVYYPPKTAVVLDFTYTVEHFERGPLANYAESMLGVSEIVDENKKVYVLKDVHIGTATTTDYSRPRKVTSTAGIPMLLTINDKGLLTSYNMPVEPAQPEKKKPSDRQKADRSCPSLYPVAPYSEEVLKAATPLAMAHEVAKQILHLRETRMYLLNGEVEHAPSDGKAMQLVLEELNNQERALTELFIGKRHKTTEQKQVRFEPKKKDQLLFFSSESGFTSGAQAGADTVRIRVNSHPQVLKKVQETKKNKKKPELSQLVYNIPGNSDIEVVYDEHVMSSRTIPVAQLGVDVALPQEWFTGKELPVILFSEKTGNIISVSK